MIDFVALHLALGRLTDFCEYTVGDNILEKMLWKVARLDIGILPTYSWHTGW